MAIFRPYVDAIQWTGSNVTEIRQFVRASTGIINDAVIRNGVLYLTMSPSWPANEVLIAVPIGDWVIKSGSQVFTLTQSDFAAQYMP